MFGLVRKGRLTAANRATREAVERTERAEVEVREVSGANGRLAVKLDKAEKALARTHEARDEAFKQMTARDAENAKLAGELKAALGVIEAHAREWDAEVAS